MHNYCHDGAVDVEEDGMDNTTGNGDGDMDVDVDVDGLMIDASDATL